MSQFPEENETDLLEDRNDGDATLWWGESLDDFDFDDQHAR